MNTKTLLSAAIVIALLCLIGFGYFKQEHSSASIKSISSESASNSSVQSKADIENVVKSYLLNNPEVIEESMRNLYNKKMKAELERTNSLIKEKTKELEEDLMSPKVGSLTPKIKIIEFFDYNCGYCKHMLPIKKKILDELKDVQIIMKELPILGDNSKMMARSAIAVNLVDSSKYFDFHSELLMSQGDVSPQTLEELVKKVGVDVEKYKATLTDSRIDMHLGDNMKLASEIGVRGTPAYIIGGEIKSEPLNFEDIKQRLDKTN